MTRTSSDLQAVKERATVWSRVGWAAFTVAAAISMALLVACLVLWARSGRVTDQLVWSRDHQSGLCASGAGQVRLRRAREIPLRPLHLNDHAVSHVRPAVDFRRWFPDGTTVDRSRAGFRVVAGATDGVRYRELIVPHWTLVIVMAILPAWWAWSNVRRLRIARRHKQRRCRRCGYDLRATPLDCPECGLNVSERYRRPGATDRLAAVGLLLGLIVFASATWWSDPRVPRPPASPPPGGLATWPGWSSARSSGDPTRMRFRDEWGFVTYQGLWQADAGPMLVVLRSLRSRPWGQPFDVLVFDRSLRLVRTGRVTAYHGDLPYRFVEVYSADGMFLPRPYRSKWILSVQFWPAAQRYNPASPPFEGVGQIDRQHAGNYLYTEPVEWSDIPEPDRFTVDLRRLESTTAQTRRAEAP